MAVTKGSRCFLSIMFTGSLITLVLGIEYDRYSYTELNPPSENVQIVPIEENFSESLSDLKSKFVSHLHKRAADPPIKKAFQNEKKVVVKSPTTINPVVLSKKQDSEDKNDQENSTLTSNSTVIDSAIGTNVSIETNITANVTSYTPTSITDFPEIPPTRPSEVTNTTVDNHVYYNSSFYAEEEKAMSFWVNFDELPKEKVVTHHMLSASHRRAATVTLSFDFPFYGHPLRNITIATGGFLYMGDYMHSWLAATQYIAPLMANFDTSLSNESTVRYIDNGTAFVIQWNEVALQDEKQGGNFTFQATLLKNGNIIFVYETIPVAVTEIGDDSHPVKVGLSDAYVIDRTTYFIRRKTIYEYHRIDMKREDIANHTAIYFTALTTCLSFQDCKSCMETNIVLECVWCETAKRCSDGLDRQRQDWLQQRCDVQKSKVNCSFLPPSNSEPAVQPFTDTPKIYTVNVTAKHDTTVKPSPSPSPQLPGNPSKSIEDDEISHSAQVSEQQSALGVGGVVAILLILAIVLGLVVWVGYAYRNPHTSSGQLLIKYRPTQWRFRSGEARYTAASVHM